MLISTLKRPKPMKQTVPEKQNEPIIDENTDQYSKWFVVYAKVIDDKGSNIRVTEAHFGGVGNTEEIAEQIARECVNSIKGGTPIVKLFRANGILRLKEVMDEADEKFRLIEERMLMTAEIINRGAPKKK